MNFFTQVASAWYTFDYDKQTDLAKAWNLWTHEEFQKYISFTLGNE